MNTLGKLLVILNLLFALAVAGFLAVDFATRTRWKEYADSLNAEMKALQDNSQQEQQTKLNLEDELRKSRIDLDGALIAKNREIGSLKSVIEKEQKATSQHKINLDAAVLNHQKAVEEAKRLQLEVVELVLTIKKREADILVFQKRIDKLQTEYQAADLAAKSANERSVALFNQNKQLLTVIADMEAKTAPGSAVTQNVYDPNFVNPPPVNVKGVIQKVDQVNKGLVQISLGSDAGLKENHTLEIYRLSPQPEYLGRLRIVQAHHHLSIGQLVRPSNMSNASPLQEGDKVASKLAPQ